MKWTREIVKIELLKQNPDYTFKETDGELRVYRGKKLVHVFICDGDKVTHHRKPIAGRY